MRKAKCQQLRSRDPNFMRMIETNKALFLCLPGRIIDCFVFVYMVPNAYKCLTTYTSGLSESSSLWTVSLKPNIPNISVLLFLVGNLKKYSGGVPGSPRFVSLDKSDTVTLQHCNTNSRSPPFPYPLPQSPGKQNDDMPPLKLSVYWWEQVVIGDPWPSFLLQYKWSRRRLPLHFCGGVLPAPCLRYLV